MTAHNHALVEASQVTQRFFLVLGLERLGEVQRFHLDQDVDAPAVGRPVGEVGVVVCRAGPDKCTVLHLAVPSLFAALIGLVEDPADLLLCLEGTRVGAAVHLVVPLAVELVAGTEQLRIGRLVDLPLFKLVLGLGVEALDLGEVGIPVPFGAGALFDVFDARADILGAHLHGGLVHIADREAQVEDRHIGEATGEVGRSHGRTVAGHRTRNEHRAHVGFGVQHQRAALGGRDRAGIGRQAEGFDRVDIGHADQLVDLGHQEHRQQLVRDAEQIGEAGHDLAHRHLVEGDELLVELLAVAVFLIGLGDEHQVFGDIAEDIVDQQVAHAQVGAAQTHDILVHEAVAAEVRDHPAVVQGGVERRDQIAREGREQHQPHSAPLVEVIGRILDAAPLAADRGHGALAVETAEVLFTVDQQVLPLFRRHRHDRVKFLFDAAAVVLEVVGHLLADGLPVGLFEHFTEDAHDLHEVFTLGLPVDVVSAFPERGIREFHSFLFCHYAIPSFCSLWMRLISRDSTKAWTRVRSWPELPLLYRRSMDSTGQPYSSAMMWLTRARSKPQ